MAIVMTSHLTVALDNRELTAADGWRIVGVVVRL